MTDQNSKNDDLDDNWIDRITALTKNALGYVPMIGGPLAEIVGTAVPGQRADRIVRYLRGLHSRVENLEQEVKDGLASNAEKIDLIEEGGYQAARATTQERIDMIIEAVSRGISENDTEIIRRKRLLFLLGQLDEDEVEILYAYGKGYGGLDRDAFSKVKRPRPSRLGSSDDDIAKNSLFDAGENHLHRLGLLKKNYGHLKSGQTPDFDHQKGDFKHRPEISHLGRLLLKEIGLASSFDEQSP